MTHETETIDVTPDMVESEAEALVRRDGRRGVVIMALARHLYETMERLDPSTEEGSWDGLTQRQHEYYFYCVDALLEQDGLMSEALSLADDNLIFGSAQFNK